MRVVQIEIPEDLADRLAPYQDQLVELLEIGLRDRQKEQTTPRDQVYHALAASGRVIIPLQRAAEPTYVRQMPVSITGKPVSEIVIEQRR